MPPSEGLSSLPFLHPKLLVGLPTGSTQLAAVGNSCPQRGPREPVSRQAEGGREREADLEEQMEGIRPLAGAWLTSHLLSRLPSSFRPSPDTPQRWCPFAGLCVSAPCQYHPEPPLIALLSDYINSLSLPPCAACLSSFTQQVMCFPAGSDSKESACNAGDPVSIPDLGRSPGEGKGNPRQYSCLENPMDGGAWWATVHGVTKSQTRLNEPASYLYAQHVSTQFLLLN